MATPPAGYARVVRGRCEVITEVAHVADAETLLLGGTLHQAAATDLAARPLQGRGVAYAIALPKSGRHVVVRHNWHGGLFAPLTRDFFLAPTRAPMELELSLRLRALGIRTPAVVMYGTSPAYGAFLRADVVTEEIPDARDLGSYLLPGESSSSRNAAWAATRELVATLNDSGVRHHDLNVKNVLLSRGNGALSAWLLDVDRVELGAENDRDIATANVARLARSARKWRDQRGADVSDETLAELELLAR